MKNNIFLISEEDESKRLDMFLKNKFEDKSRSYMKKLIENGNITVNDQLKKSNYKLKINDKIDVSIPKENSLKVEAENIPLNILYEDDDVIVVNKDQGMVVHPGSGNLSGTLVNALLYYSKNLSKINGIMRPGIVHRIDKDTSGVLVVAKNDKAHENLAAQLKDHSMNRVYVALVEGRLKEEEGIIDKPLGRNPKDRIKMAVVQNGKNAVTHYRIIKQFHRHTLVECKLETGRTHQIRVHMAYIGHPVVGDKVYGYKKQIFKLDGQMLHAKKLGFIHPSTNKYVEFDTELPKYYTSIIKCLENKLK